MQEYVLSVKVANNEGVLLRVSSLFSRRCFNIKSLNAAETEIPEISRLTIVVAGDLRVLEQIKNQLMKLHDVKEVKILTDAVCREHVIVRAGRSVEDRRGIVEVANLFRAKSVDIAFASSNKEWRSECFYPDLSSCLFFVNEDFTLI